MGKEAEEERGEKKDLSTRKCSKKVFPYCLLLMLVEKIAFLFLLLCVCVCVTDLTE